MQSKGIAMPTGWHYAGNLVTAAIAGEANTQSVWLMQETSATAANRQSIWISLGPVLVLLIIALVWIGHFSRKPV
jgi:hypothetical protein